MCGATPRRSPPRRATIDDDGDRERGIERHRAPRRGVVARLTRMPASTPGSSPLRGVLHVIHGHGGGTEHHARALIDASRAHFRHHLAIAVGARWQVEAHAANGGVRTFELAREEGESWAAFVGGLCASFGVDVIHLHNITGCREGLLEALATLDIPYG